MSMINILTVESTWTCQRETLSLSPTPPTDQPICDIFFPSKQIRCFRMDCGTLNILGTKVMPMLFVRVKVEAEQSMAEIMVERVELDGSDAVRSAGGTFNGKPPHLQKCVAHPLIKATGTLNLSDASLNLINSRVEEETT